MGQATTSAEAQFWLQQPRCNCNLPLFFPPSSLRLNSALPFLMRVWVSPWKNCGIKDVCRLVLEHFHGLMRLVIFPWNKKVNPSSKFPYLFCPPIFLCCILRRRGCLWTPLVAVYRKANPAYPRFYIAPTQLLWCVLWIFCLLLTLNFPFHYYLKKWKSCKVVAKVVNYFVGSWEK